MNPELEKVIKDAKSDPATFVERVLTNPAKLEALAQLRAEEPTAFELLLLELEKLKCPHRTRFKTAVGKVKLNGHEVAAAPTTQAEIIAVLAAQVDDGATGFESTAAVLNDIHRFVATYISFPDLRQADAVTLWVAHTWAVDCFDITPRLSVQAPQRESGKTRLLEVCAVLSFRPKMWILPSAAVIYRTLDLGPTTLFLDEVDAIFRGRNAEHHDDVRAIVNEGYTRNGTVPRMVHSEDGKSMKVVEFPVFAPVAMAGIGGVHDTIESRSLVIRLQRQKKRGRAAKFRRREVDVKAGEIRDRLTLWSGIHADELRSARPAPPRGLSDRAEDIWEPLLAIAELAGEDWRKRADEAAQFLAARTQDRIDDPHIWLLRDMKVIFDGFVEPKMFTAQILERLKAMEESPWRNWGGSRRREPGITAQDLARMFNEFEIRPLNIRIGERGGPRGYQRSDFEDAWDRYLSAADDADVADAVDPFNPFRTPEGSEEITSEEER